jgi:hypothetical protein
MSYYKPKLVESKLIKYYMNKLNTIKEQNINIDNNNYQCGGNNIIENNIIKDTIIENNIIKDTIIKDNIINNIKKKILNYMYNIIINYYGLIILTIIITILLYIRYNEVLKKKKEKLILYNN